MKAQHTLVPATAALPLLDCLPCLPACSFIGVAGRELNGKWDENGAGAVFFLEQEMSDGLTGKQPAAWLDGGVGRGMLEWGSPQRHSRPPPLP